MNRFFVAPGTTRTERFAVPATIAHQVHRVLRLADGERLVLLEGDGLETVCRLEDGVCVVEERRPARGEPGHRLMVVQALLKGDHLEEVVRHGTEIGISAFQLTVTARCIARELSERRLDRLRSIAREAAEQSERGLVPEVAALVPLESTIGPRSVVLFERHEGERLSAMEPPVRLIIGPEGGFTPEEVAAAERAGASVAGLGPRILRSETVALAAAAVVLARTGDFA